MTDRTEQISKWENLPHDSVILKTIEALKNNGIYASVVDTGEQARKKVLEIIPKGSEVMNMTSKTLEATGLFKEIMESTRFDAVKKKMMTMDRNTQGKEMRMMGSAPDFAIGSVHAVTEDGKVLIASASGSQLPAYAYGAGKVIWIVGTQKIVKNLDEGMKRVFEHSLPLEDERMRSAMGRGSSVNKLLIVNREFVPGRITLIFVKEKLGF